MMGVACWMLMHLQLPQQPLLLLLLALMIQQMTAARPPS
jgi:hypothetical protein